MKKQKKKTEEREKMAVFYVHPNDAKTNDVVWLNFPECKETRRLYRGEPTFFFLLFSNQLKDLEKNKKLMRLDYYVLAEDVDEGLIPWISPQEKPSPTVKANILKISQLRDNKGIVCSSSFRSGNRKHKLKTGDVIIYDRKKKFLSFLKKGKAPLIYTGAPNPEGIKLGGEEEADSLVKLISAAIGKAIGRLEKFEIVLYEIF